MDSAAVPRSLRGGARREPAPGVADAEFGSRSLARPGRAPARPFSKEVHPFKWRGYHDYGCGALGDMACHLMDASYWVLELGAPTSVELKRIDGRSNIAFPNSAIVEYQFPARGSKPPVKLTWYEGGLKPEKPATMEEARKLALRLRECRSVAALG